MRDPATALPLKKWKHAPLVYFFATTVAVFLIEGAFMHPLFRRVEGDTFLLALIDGTLLTMILSPVFYAFIYRPLLRDNRLRQDMLVEREAVLRHLSQSEGRYRALFENNHAVMLLVDPAEGEIVDANPAAAKFYGYSRETLRNLKVENINILSPQEIADEMHKAQTEQKVHFDFRHRLADGSVRNVEVFSGPIEIEGRRLLYSIIHDVTEAKGAVNALRCSEERMKSIFRLAGAGIATVSPEGRFLQVNPAFCAFLGYAEEELLRLNIEDVTWIEDLPRTLQHLALVRAGKLSDLEQEKRYRRKDGTVVWGHLSASWVSDPEGVPQYAISLVQDITEHKKAEEALRNANRMLEAIFAAAPLPLIAMDLDRRVRSWNPAAERLFGWRSEEVVGLPYPLVPASHAKELEHHWRETLRGNIMVGKETVRLRKDGSLVEVNLSTAQIFDGDGTVTGNLVIFEEITARKRMEAELRQAKESAERANQAKSDFLANMSHEIRTPMNGVLGMTEVVLGTDLAPDQRECLQLAHDSARSLLRLLNDILDFSRLEAGMLTLSRVEFDLAEVLDGAVKTFGILAHQKGLPLRLTVTPDVPPRVVGDPARLRQIVMNLVANAVKFTDRGEVSLYVAPENAFAGDRRLRFSVRDTGIGIPPGEQERIFDSFVQVDGSTTRRHGGSGLGLTICRNIVRLMGGEIWVESRPGEGSTFHFTADLAPPEAPEEVAPGSMAALLLVDDNPVHLDLLEQTVAQIGLRSVCAGSGSEALGLLRQGARNGKPYAAVLTDLIMPGMDGLQLAEAIRSDPYIPPPRLILLTSGVGVEKSRWESAGFTASLQKPLNAAELAAALPLPTEAENPLLPPEAENPLLPPEAENPLPPPVVKNSPPSPTGLKILLVEDERTNQKLARMILESRGHTVTVAENGKEGLERLAEHPFDLVLMDVQMPVMDGLEATRRIRSETAGRFDPAIPVIAMTAHALEDDRQACLAAGMSGYLSKPLDLRGFMEAVEEFGVGARKGAVTVAQVVNVAGVLALLGEDREGCREVWKAFRSDAPRQIARISELLEGGGPPLARAAHTLKGAAAAAGAERVRLSAAALEETARRDDLQERRRLLRELIDETSRALESMTTLI